MKHIIIFYFLLCFSFPTKAQSLRWLDIEKKSVYRIDIKKSILENSSNSNEWQEIGKAYFKNIQEKDILTTHETICLNTDDQNLVYLLVNCTNQVYKFNYKTLLLERVDKTYYGGFNCRSTKFIRNKTIYSVGGYGLFRSNNLMVYYDENKQEWSAINFLNDAPKSIFVGLSGYVKKTDSFLTGFNDFISESENSGKSYTDYGFYEYKFKDNKWYKLGEIKQTLLRNHKIKNFQYFHWNGKYFVFRENEQQFSSLIIIDPFLNEVYRWIDKERLFSTKIPETLEYEYIYKDSLFSYKVFNTGNRNSIEKFGISIEATKKQAVYIGKLYETENNNFLIFLTVGIGLLIILLVFYFKFYTAKRNSKKTLLSTSTLNNEEIRMVDVLIKNHENGGTSTEQINHLLNIDDKSVENQRKLRHEFIKSLNLKLKLIHNFDNVIERKSSSIDRRIFNYQLSDEIIQMLKKEYKDVLD